MVECEFLQSHHIHRFQAVLIDTWWNVNRIKAKVFEEGKAVLIDTWWNVNSLSAHVILIFCARFNRYMVECE